MNGDASSWHNLTQEIAQRVAAYRLADKADIAICPPMPGLAITRKTIADNDAEKLVSLGAQNLYPGHNGAFTGETSPDMLKNLGCRYVILGHSERREHFSESNAFVSRKVITALETDLTPIVCVGEGEGVGDASAFIKKQLSESLQGVSVANSERLIVAYEPVWAISTYSDNPRKATPDIIGKATEAIRTTLQTLYGDEIGGKIRILYGGSMKAENAEEIMKVPDVGGGLIGGASLKAEDFIALVKNSCL